MDLRTHYDSLPNGGRRELAAAIGVAPTYLYQIVRGLRPIQARLCWPVQIATNGAVTIHDLRPDLFGPAPGIPPTPAPSAQERAA